MFIEFFFGLIPIQFWSNSDSIQIHLEHPDTFQFSQAIRIFIKILQ